jgi:hypothetical protein
MLAKIGLSLFRTWSSIRKYVCVGDCGLFANLDTKIHPKYVILEFLGQKLPILCVFGLFFFTLSL